MELDRRCRILVALLVLVWDRLSFCCRRVPCEKMHWSLMNRLLSPTVLPINDAKPICGALTQAAVAAKSLTSLLSPSASI